MLKKITYNLICLFILTIGLSFHHSYRYFDEGMFPLSELSRAGLKKAGLKISEKEIYNPGQVGLVDALVRVGGCTGSFVSPNGLIITNHHCAFSAVQLASTPEHNYLENGFVAKEKEHEIEAKGLSIRITESYEDVSAQVLDGVSEIADPSERIALIAKRRTELAEKAERENAGIKAEVSEMFIGKSYVLFKYKTIEDVRLVYIPRQSIGEFGYERDNWVWPRHTGDYSFMRAYVASDGSAAPYSKDNVPYQPKKHLKVNPNGVEENDFVFILGYPGRTFRHRPYQYVSYQEKFLLPYTSELYDFQNQQMETAGEKDKNTELALATRIKRNANVLKNYRGKLKGLRNIQLVNQKQKEDEELGAFINSKPELNTKYGTLLSKIDNHYKTVFADAPKELWMNNIYSSLISLQIASNINAFQEALSKAMTDQKRKELYDANISRFKNTIGELYKVYNSAVELSVGKHVFVQGLELKGSNSLPFIETMGANNQTELENKIQKLISESVINDKDRLTTNLNSPEKILGMKDDLLELEKAIRAEYQTFYKEQQRREGVLNQLMADYVEVKEIFQNKQFIPDANSTLRLTYGRIKGYSPADATYMTPFTTVKGLIEKGNSGMWEYIYPDKIKETWEKQDFGPYVKKDLHDVPVNILYNMDTTGGNSGSPVMNSRGQLIGVNFDRAYDATINDFAWNESYSRSIGVDIRYVLWVADKVDDAQYILREMGL